MNFKAVRRCERAREYASLALDDELSQFEHAPAARARQCDGCRSYHVGLVATTRTERFARAALPSIALPRRRRYSFRGVRVRLVAALVVVAVGLGTVLSSVGSSDTVPPNVSLPNTDESAEMRTFAASGSGNRVPAVFSRRPRDHLARNPGVTSLPVRFQV